MKITFSGDIAFNNKYELVNKKYFNNFRLPSKTDYFIGNLECFVRGEQGVSPYKIPSLGTSSSSMEHLLDLGITHVALANNHTYDNLESGYINTISKLDSINIGHFGANVGSPCQTHLILKDSCGVSVGILNYVDKSTNPCPPPNTEINVSYFNSETINQDIDELKKTCQYVVVYIHWGGKSENMKFPDCDQVKTANLMAKTNADVIIGHHSHVVHPIVSIKGKKIYYSLGNFCFDDIQFNDKLLYLKKKNKFGILVQLEFNSTRIKHKVFRTVIEPNGSVSITEQKPNNHLFFNLLCKIPILLDFQFHFNQKIIRPIKFLFKGNPLVQLRKIDSKKLKSLFK